jgi:hypothetical protein
VNALLKRLLRSLLGSLVKSLLRSTVLGARSERNMNCTLDVPM